MDKKELDKEQPSAVNKEEEAEPTTSKARKCSYAKGVLGTIVGALIGCLLWISIAYFVGGNLHLAFGFVLVICAFYGYFIAGGKDGRGFFPIFIIGTVLFAIVVFFVASTVEYINTLDFIGTSSFSAYARASFGGSELRAYLDIFATCFGIIVKMLGSYLKDFLVMLIFVSVGIVHYSVNKSKLLLEPEKKDCKEETEK